MTNEELDNARAEHAWSEHYAGSGRDATVIAARLAREGWTPPVVVDPDWAEAQDLALWAESNEIFRSQLAHEALKRGRELERAEAKPGMVWEKWDGSRVCPVNQNWFVAVFRRGEADAARARLVDWQTVTHYAIITQPEEK
jgi:hypothetical protein